MANDNDNEPNSLLQNLLGIYRQDPFLGRFLAAFEKILLGGDDGRSIPALSLRPDKRHGQPLAFQGLEESIAAIATLFIPFVAECVPLKEKVEITSNDSVTRHGFLPC